jgi:hypothetical protein
MPMPNDALPRTPVPAETGYEILPLADNFSRSASRIFGRLSLLLACALGLALFGGCATAAQQRVVAEARHVDVPFALIVKLRVGDQLDAPDLAILARQRVPDEVVIDYLILTEARYHVTPAIVPQLRADGLSERMIEYLRSTPERFKDRYNPGIRHAPPRRPGRVAR